MGRGRLSGDGAFLGGMVLLGALVPLLALLMAYALYRGGSLALGQMGFVNFVLGERWDPVAGVFGAWPYILGTLLVSFSALFLSLLPALAIALLSAEYAPKGVARVLDLALDLMAAVPSVVYGLWGVLVLAPWLRNAVELPLYAWAAAHAPALASFLGVPTGYGLLTAILLLASMIIPFSAAVARDALALVPAELRQAAYALGATHWEVVRRVVLPSARTGILAGLFLALARALGETMAVTMVIGNAHTLPYTLFGGAATMPSVIANEFTEAVTPLHLSALLGVGFLLFLVSLATNLLVARILGLGGQAPREVA